MHLLEDTVDVDGECLGSPFLGGGLLGGGGGFDGSGCFTGSFLGTHYLDYDFCF